MGQHLGSLAGITIGLKEMGMGGKRQNQLVPEAFLGHS